MRGYRFSALPDRTLLLLGKELIDMLINTAQKLLTSFQYTKDYTTRCYSTALDSGLTTISKYGSVIGTL